MTDEVREKVVLALTSTTREQCVGYMVQGAARCALSVIAEGFGVVLKDEPHKIASDDAYRALEVLSDDERFSIFEGNDDAGLSFDEIAKLVKDRVI